MGTPPNILILITDQQSHDLLSCARPGWAATPHLDGLAREGTRFARAYCSDPVCVPARFSLVTGRMPSAIGMRGNGGADLHAFPTAEEHTLLGHCLRQAGYATWYGGKTHWPVDLDCRRVGFTAFTTDERERLAVEAADRILRAERERPWAMVVSLINPHDICGHAIRAFAAKEDNSWEFHAVQQAGGWLGPLDEALAPPPGADPTTWIESLCPELPANHAVQEDEPALIEEVLARRPFRQRARRRWDDRAWRRHRYAYARLMARVDREIGVVLAALEASGQRERTLVIATSDHGEHAGAHRLEHKTFFYDEAARVPLLLRWPAVVPAGRVIEDSVAQIGLDLLPTCCAAAGVPPPAHARGQNLVAAAIAGRAQPEAYGENLVSRMLVTPRWKFVRYDRGEHAEQLYDLATDPGETRNAVHDRPAIAAELRERLTAQERLHAAAAFGPLSTQPIAE